MLVRVLESLLAHPLPRGEAAVVWIQRWLTESAVGRQWASYLSAEAELLLMAANRLNLSGDEELREMAQALSLSAARLRQLSGTRTAE